MATDAIEWFKKLPTADKVALGLVAIGGVLLVWQPWNKPKESSSDSGTLLESLTSGGSGSGTDSGYTGTDYPVGASGSTGTGVVSSGGGGASTVGSSGGSTVGSSGGSTVGSSGGTTVGSSGGSTSPIFIHFKWKPPTAPVYGSGGGGGGGSGESGNGGGVIHVIGPKTAPIYGSGGGSSGGRSVTPKSQAPSGDSYLNNLLFQLTHHPVGEYGAAGDALQREADSALHASGNQKYAIAKSIAFTLSHHPGGTYGAAGEQLQGLADQYGQTTGQW
jgi:hypothetical protein